MAVPIAAKHIGSPCAGVRRRGSIVIHRKPAAAGRGGLYLHVADEEQLIRQAEVLLADRPAWASQLCVACTVVPVVHLDMAVLAGRLRRFVGGLASAPQGGHAAAVELAARHRARG